MLFVSVVLLLFAKKSEKNKREKTLIHFILGHGDCMSLCCRVTLILGVSDLFLTCNSCVVSGLGCGFRERPLPPDGRHFSGTLACVGDAGAVLLVGPCALSTVAEPVILLSVGADSVLHLSGLLVRRSSAVCGYFLPLKPALQRRLRLEVKVPAATVLLSDLL